MNHVQTHITVLRSKCVYMQFLGVLEGELFAVRLKWETHENPRISSRCSAWKWQSIFSCPKGSVSLIGIGDTSCVLRRFHGAIYCCNWIVSSSTACPNRSCWIAVHVTWYPSCGDPLIKFQTINPKCNGIIPNNRHRVHDTSPKDITCVAGLALLYPGISNLNLGKIFGALGLDFLTSWPKKKHITGHRSPKTTYHMNQYIYIWLYIYVCYFMRNW